MIVFPGAARGQVVDRILVHDAATCEVSRTIREGDPGALN
jgi:hypothetical protein